MKILIYTAIFGEYDIPKTALKQTKDVDFLLITESENTAKQAEEKGWKTKIVDIEAPDSRTKNRYFKFHPYKVSKKYDLYIYVDGSAYITSDKLVEMVVSQMGKYNLMMFRHPEKRDCLYQEAEYASKLPKYHERGLVEWAEKYREEGMPEHFGLWACGLIASKPSKGNKKMFDTWWSETEKGCYLDQVVLPYLLWKTGLPIKTLELDLFNNEYISFQMVEHASVL